MTTLVSHSTESRSRFSSDPLRCPSAQRYFLDGPNVVMTKPRSAHHYSSNDYPSPVNSSALSPDYTHPTADQLPPTPPATLRSISFNTSDDLTDGSLLLPTYDSDYFGKESRPLSEDSLDSPIDFQRSGPQTPAVDDSSVEEEPSRHVDYLSHEWREEDIWTSWRYVAIRRGAYDNGVRLENASWRTWAKVKFNLGTVSPDALNWLKDCDVTWLYGPLKTYSARENTLNLSPPPSCETPYLYLDRKSILKKRTASETILQRSLSQHTLLQHAGAILQAQKAENHRNRPPFPSYRRDLGIMSNRSYSHSTETTLGGTATNTSPSGLGSPGERRHIHFNNEVVQCIAVEAKDEDDEWPGFSGDESFFDDGVMMKQFSTEASTSGRSTPRGSFSGENKTIAPLPPTTLKYRGDTPEPPTGSIIGCWSGYLSPSPSVGTARLPEPPSSDFLLDEDSNPARYEWTQSQDTENQNRPWFVNPEEDEDLDQHFHLAPLGMFTSYDEGESSNIGIFDRVVDTVNTARDIAHVIWNVGWRR